MQYLTHIEPFTALDRLWSSFNEDLPRAARTAGHTPAVDVVESGDAYSIELEIPGVDPSTVEVTLLEDVLTIAGEKPQRPELNEDERVWTRERQSGRFERRFRFPVGVDAQGVEAHAEHGVLHVRVAKAPEAKPRRIDIKS